MIGCKQATLKADMELEFLTKDEESLVPALAGGFFTTPTSSPAGGFNRGRFLRWRLAFLGMAGRGNAYLPC